MSGVPLTGRAVQFELAAEGLYPVGETAQSGAATRVGATGAVIADA